MTEVSLPSGLRVDLRPLTLADDAVVFDGSDERTFPEVAVGLIGAATERVLDPGPYPFEDRVDWNKVLPGDLRAAALAFRRLNDPDGAMLAVDAVDPSRPTDPPIEWDIDIRMMSDGGDIIDYPLEDGAAERIRGGTPFEAKLGDRLVQFRHMTVEDWAANERGAGALDDSKATAEDKARVRHDQLYRRIIAVEGVDRMDVRSWIRKLTWAEATELETAMNDAVGGGIDQAVDITTDGGRTLTGVIPFTVLLLMRIPKAPKGRREKRKAEILAARESANSGGSGEDG